MTKQTIILLIILISGLSCRKFVWDNPNDTIYPDKEPSSLKDGLVAYYPFNGNANDESGNGNNGIVVGAQLVTDRFNNTNKAFEFFGGTNCIQVKNKASIVLNQTFSISIWVNLSLIETFNSFISHSSSGEPSVSGYVWGYSGYSNPPRIHFQAYPNFIINNITTSTLGGNMQVNKWYNLVCVYEKENKDLRYYFNGKQTDSFSMNYNISNNNLDLYFGNHFANNVIYANPYGPLKGKLDDIRIYNRVLTQEEITYLANN